MGVWWVLCCVLCVCVWAAAGAGAGGGGKEEGACADAGRGPSAQPYTPTPTANRPPLQVSITAYSSGKLVICAQPRDPRIAQLWCMEPITRLVQLPCCVRAESAQVGGRVGRGGAGVCVGCGVCVWGRGM